VGPKRKAGDSAEYGWIWMDMGAPYMVFVYMPKKHQKTQLLKLKTWTLDDFG
jgi:hypothetical protein